MTSQNPYAFARSPSQLRTYFTCPRQWFLRYAPGQRWRSRSLGAALIQGSVYHRMMELLMTQLDVQPIDPLEYFAWLWDGVGAGLEKDQKIEYPKTDSWGRMGQRGRKFWGLWTEPLLDAFAARLAPDDLPRLGAGLPLRLVEEQVRFNRGFPMLTIVDYAGPLWVRRNRVGELFPIDDVEKRGEPVLVRAMVDYKTTKYEKEATAAELDAQLMCEQLALQSLGATVDVVGLCDLVVQQERPRVQWLLRPAFDAHQLAAYTADALYADRAICDGQFPMLGRFTGACENYGGCDYKALCFPSMHGEVVERLYQEVRADDAPGISFEEFEG